MTTPQPRFKGLLVMSLLLNVFLLGGLGGGAYEWWAHRKPVAAVPQHGLRQALAQLPAERRHELRRLLRQARAQSEPLIQARREARQEVARQLKSPDLDRNVLDSQLNKARDADIALRARVDTTLADFAASLDPAERQALVQSMQGHGGMKE